MKRELSARELEILRLVGEGYATKQIAAVLQLSPQTVANHRKRICRKLDVHSTAELVAYAVKDARVDARSVALKRLRHCRELLESAQDKAAAFNEQLSPDLDRLRQCFASAETAVTDALSTT